jgi:hypothetical protein
MKEERRLVGRVLRHWREIANGGRFPRRDEIDLLDAGRGRGELPVDRGGLADRAFAFRRGR